MNFCETSAQFAASRGQRALHAAQLIDPESAAHNLSRAIRFRQPLDLCLVERCFHLLVSRHEALRATFAVFESGSRMTIGSGRRFSLSVEDGSGLDDHELGPFLSNLARRSFDLSAGPLLRVHVLRMGADDHILLLSTHHIVSDGWSQEILFKEFGACYNALLEGTEPSFPARNAEYSDYSRWHHKLLRGEFAPQAQAHWRDALADVQALELPYDAPRGTGAAGRQTRIVPAELLNDLKDLARRQGVSLYVVLLAAYQALLARICAQTDISVATPMDCRDERQFYGVVGYLSNLTIIRTAVDEGCSFTELLARVADSVVTAKKWQHYPHSLVVNEHGNGSGDPSLFTRAAYTHRRSRGRSAGGVGAVFLGSQSRSVQIGPLMGEIVPIDEPAALFDLYLATMETADGLELAATYDEGRFEGSTIARILERFHVLLSAAARAPTTPCDNLAVSTLTERGVLEALQSSKGAFEQYLLDERFLAMCDKFPNHVALVEGDRRYSYRALSERAQQYAASLRTKGLVRGSRVAIFLEPGFELVASILGTLIAGAAYVPLDSRFPSERLRHMLSDAECAHVIVDPTKLDSTILEMIRAANVVSPVCVGAGYEAAVTFQPERSLDDLAYIIYTSGSTGWPKGVAITHACVSRLFAATREQFAIDERDVWTLFHSAAFDFSVWEMFGALLHGGTLVVVPPDTRRNPARLHETLRAHDVTVLNQTPSAFLNLLNADTAHPDAPLTSLRLIVFGGEALDPSTLRPWFERYGDHACDLVNMYGITETTVHVTYRSIRAGDTLRHGVSPIGWPLPDLAVRILDKELRNVPLGTPGEICVSGPGLAMKYLNQPELTDVRFPILPATDERIYRSGDRGRWTSNGELEYLGRIDDQVKIRGFRIELGEIESFAATHESIREAAAVVVGATPMEHKIVLAVAANGSDPVAGLRDHLARHLPKYMMPSGYLIVDSLPRSPTGKIDRRSLREAAAETLEAPANDNARADGYSKTQKLSTIFCSLLGVDAIDPEANFFNAGGDSLMSLSVVARARAVGLRFDARDVFENPTILGLAEVAREVCGPEARHHVEPFSLISDRDRQALAGSFEDAYPLTALQAGMIFHSEMLPGEDVYREIFSVPVAFRLEPELLDHAVAEVIDRHPALRTAIDLVSFAEPLQLVAREVHPRVQYFDISEFTPKRQKAQLAVFREGERTQAFALSEPPLFRTFAHRLDEHSFQLTFSFHHVILDGWSLATTVAELLALYLSKLSMVVAEPSAPAAPLVPLLIQSERAAVLSEESVRFWRARIGNAPIARLLSNSGTASTASSERYRHKLGQELTENLRQTAAKLGVPLKSLLLAAHVYVMTLVTGEDDLVTGLVFNCRPEVEGGERSVGIFLNTLPVRINTAGLSWTKLVSSVAAEEAATMPHRFFPLADVQRLSASGSSLFEHNFNYINMRIYNELLGDHAKSQANGFDVFERTNHTLTVVCELGIDGLLSVSVRYLTPRIEAEQAVGIARYFDRALRHIVADPDAQCAQSDLLPSDEKDLLRELATADDGADLGFATLTEWIGSSVASRPHSIAVESADGKVTYSELDRQATLVAHRLIASGVTPGSPVAVLTSRRLESIVAMWAALKVGAAYAPIDATDPVARIRRSLDRLRPAAVLDCLAEVPPDVSPHEVLSVTHICAGGADRDHPLPSLEVKSSSDAYIMFTSGSSGTPKGVPVTHRQIAGYVRAFLGRFPDTAGKRFAGSGRLHWDHPYSCILAALCSGGTICLPSDGDIQSPEAFARFIQACGVDVLKTLPSLLDAFLDSGQREDVLPSQLLIFGGERLDQALVSRVSAIAPTLRIVNHYGPTETAIGVASARVDQLAGNESPPIGRPLSHARLAVVDCRLALAPLGTPGELLVGGPAVGRGYLEDGPSTDDKYVSANLFGHTEDFYRTGDRVRWRSDRQLEFLGRTDRQLKLRGFRIDLGEIETSVARVPGFREGVTIARDAGQGPAQLVTFVVIDEARQVAAGARGDLLDSEHVEEWRVTHEELYGSADLEDSAPAGAIGWNDSYTGAPFSKSEMDEYLKNYEHLVGPSNFGAILEVGCGSGFVAVHLAGRSKSYLGIDLSANAIVRLNKSAEHLCLPQLHGQQKAAHEIQEIDEDDFDSVVFASVVQKFPSLEYLDQCLLAAIDKTRSGGDVILSDIRNLETLRLFHTSLQLERDAGASAKVIRERVERSERSEAELVIAPAYFWALGDRHERVGRVEVRPKRGRIHNELTCFRYDVVLRLDRSDGDIANVVDLAWHSQSTLADLSALLFRADRPSIVLHAAPDERLAAATEADRLLMMEDTMPGSVIARKAMLRRDGALDIEALYDLCDRTSYRLCYDDAEGMAVGRVNIRFDPALKGPDR